MKHEYKHTPFFIMDFGLDRVDGVRRFHFESDSFAREAAINDQPKKLTE